MVISDFNIICLAQKGAELFNSKMIKSTANNLNVKKVLTYIDSYKACCALLHIIKRCMLRHSEC